MTRFVGVAGVRTVAHAFEAWDKDVGGICERALARERKLSFAR
jgi:hypothetical protein